MNNKGSFKISGIKDFNLEHIFDCGQCFRWEREDDGSYTGVVGNFVTNMQIVPNQKTAPQSSQILQPDTDDSQNLEVELVIDNCTEQEFYDFWFDYLHLGCDYGEIKSVLSSQDEVMKRTSKYGCGIRLLRQDIWETVISFIISQNSNIPRIKKCISTLCENFGESLGIYRGKERFSFPGAQRLASLSLEDLESCRLGYRDKYILETSKAVAADNMETLKQLPEMPLPQAEEYIRSLHGIGPKVANCILLFGAYKYESFPIDVWMRRTMAEFYGFDENDIKGMQQYAASHFGKYSGFAQQYLFYYARENGTANRK